MRSNETLDGACIGATTPTLVAGEIPGVAISSDMRLIADIRIVYRSCAEFAYRATQVKQIKDLAREGLILKKRFGGREINCARRDVDSPSRRILTHPNAGVIMRTEL